MSDETISVGDAKKLIDGWPAALSGAAGDVTPGSQTGAPDKHDHGAPRPPILIAKRVPLPISTGVAKIRPGETAEIIARPQCVAFRPERMFVSNYSPEYKVPWWKRPLMPWLAIPETHGAADWIINDISIGNRSQLAQCGSLPGDMFSNLAIDSFVTFDTCQTAMDVKVIVTYIGPIKQGCPFTGAMLGTSAS